ncbi:terpene synthase family protein [Saccharopolyspora phatthalungensis]|uniref:Terpene synthase n=1 Tax=Saccharopolyspora phatthalungensis TaxID=664693 RepID=A0A840QHD7_9PSEU|nr:hypothetical protein [Saccharopolyspora phatthalungensis]MBB5159926.1 hypothetical protein [Saccharopolyspora phatthalungensis]
MRASLPAIAQRFSCDFHPDYYELIQRNEQWVVQDLCPGDTEWAQATLDMLGSTLVCTGYPRADRGRLLDICNLSTWWFMVDDQFTRIVTDPDAPENLRKQRGAEYVEDLWRLVVGEPTRTHRWPPEVIRELVDRIRGRTTPEFFQRMVEAMSTWQVRGLVAELDAPDATDEDPLQAYLRLRVDSAGPSSFMVFAEYVLELDLPSEIRSNGLIKEYERLIAEHWILPNDLLSFRKECFRGDHTNLVCLLRRNQGLSLNDALAAVATLINDRQERVLKQYDEIMATELGKREEVRMYLDALQAIGAANQRWSYLTPRYHGPRFQWNGVLSGELRLFPTHTQFPGVNAQL